VNQLRRREHELGRERAKKRYASIAAGGDQGNAVIETYDDLIWLAVISGADETALRHTSISEPSLKFMLDHIGDGPGLHIGNYAGISLAYLAARTDELIVAVDPNVHARGLAHPQDTVCRLLAAAGVQDRVVLVCGYSGQKNPSNDGWVWADGYDPQAEYANEAAPEQVIRNLSRLGLTFGWALMDGNHDAAYLRSELEGIRPLMQSGARVFLDDCNDAWSEIRAVFDDPGTGWSTRATDGRIGILQKT
jgi:hypothetical protein